MQCLKSHFDPLHAYHLRRPMPRLKRALHCKRTAYSMHRVIMKTHSEIAHQYGAFKIFLLMTSGEMGQLIYREYAYLTSDATGIYKIHKPASHFQNILLSIFFFVNLNQSNVNLDNTTMGV